MREWLSGGAPPCQGGGRGFDPRLALLLFIAEALILQGFRSFYVVADLHPPAPRRSGRLFWPVLMESVGKLRGRCLRVVPHYSVYLV